MPVSAACVGGKLQRRGLVDLAARRHDAVSAERLRVPSPRGQAAARAGRGGGEAKPQPAQQHLPATDTHHSRILRAQNRFASGKGRPDRRCRLLSRVCGGEHEAQGLVPAAQQGLRDRTGLRGGTCTNRTRRPVGCRKRPLERVIVEKIAEIRSCRARGRGGDAASSKMRGEAAAGSCVSNRSGPSAGSSGLDGMSAVAHRRAARRGYGPKRSMRKVLARWLTPK